ncbi:MAG: hypothetical protein ACI81W_003727 [Saprospiraceae bacterium]|jgi:hypothetical protein
MKKSLLLFAVCFLAFQSLQAQFKMGFRGGLSTTDVVPGELLITNSDAVKELGISVMDANYGAHIGMFMQGKIGRFFIQPEVLFNTSTVNYKIREFTGPNTVEIIKTERFQNLDIPVMMGLKYGPLRLQGGPVAHFHLNSKSDLFDLEGYDEKFDNMNWGYQAGIGLDLWKLIIDVKYEGSFQNFGDHMTFFDQDINFDKSPGRFIASVGIAF